MKLFLEHTDMRGWPHPLPAAFHRWTYLILWGRKMTRTPFDSRRATAALKGSISEELEVDEIQNSPQAMADAFKVMLDALGLEVNEPEILRWCEYQWKRRYHALGDRGAKDNIKVSTVLQHFRTYMNNWFDMHRKWLRADKGY